MLSFRFHIRSTSLSKVSRMSYTRSALPSLSCHRTIRDEDMSVPVADIVLNCTADLYSRREIVISSLCSR